jgi:D-glycero-alpha-D-manno-heptose 1-phosphate guanylyltransferase
MTACILLAGGLGTRLRGAVSGTPKCLAPVAGTAFLKIQMEHLASQGVERFVLSLGYLADQVIEVVRTWSDSFRIECVVEPHALGTGGAALFALHHAGLSEALIANADTFLDADLSPLLAPLDASRSERLRMIVVHSRDGARFGGVVVKAGRARQFLPRGAPCSGLVNAGLYRAHRNAFAKYQPGQSFSLETDVMEELAEQGKVAAAVVAGTFVDIGVPSDYVRFCEHFARSA